MWLLPSIVLSLSFLLSGCGFRPMLWQDNLSMGAHVYVSKIPDRRGMLLRQELIQRFGGLNEKSARYHLSVKYQESGRTLLVTRDNTEGRSEAQASAKITLHDTEKQKAVFRSHAQSSAAYSIGDQVAFSAYSSQVSEQSIREKILPHLADDIVIQVQTFLSQQIKAAS